MTRAQFNCTTTPGDFLRYGEPFQRGDTVNMNTIWIEDGGSIAGVDLSNDDALALALDILIMLKDLLTPEMADGIRSELPQHEAGSNLPAEEHVIPPHKDIIFNDCGVYLTRDGYFYVLNNTSNSGGAYMGPRFFEEFAGAVAKHAGLELAEPAEEDTEAKLVNPNPRFSNLNPQASLVYQHMARAGSISARDAFDDHGITSATLSRRICDIEEEGFEIVRESKKHPVTERRYTRYSLKDQPPMALPHYPE